MSDDEREKIAMQYAGANFRNSRRVRVEALSEWSRAEWTLDELIALLLKIKAEMPEDATNPRVEFEGGGYDQNGQFVVFYEAWESEDVVADRVQRALRYAASKEASEVEQYQRLKAKYG